MLKNVFIWLIAITLAVISSAVAVGAISKKNAPQISVKIKPTNGFALENLASSQFKSLIVERQGQFPETLDPEVLDLATRAFKAEPLTPHAIAALALGKSGYKKRRLMAEALNVSRREQIINGWMISDSGAREDVAALLSYYDTMLRTSTSTHLVMIPVMADALKDEDSIAPFVNLLVTNPPWAQLFWKQVVKKPDALNNAVLLREKLLPLIETGNAFSDDELIFALVKYKQFKNAEKLYQLLSSNRSASIIRDSSFRVQPEYEPLDWQLFSTGEYGAAVIGNELHLSAIHNSGGLFARQLVKIPKESVQIRAIFAQKPPPAANLFLSITCAEDIPKKPRTIRIPLRNQSARQEVNNELSACEYYWLDVVGRAPENGAGFDVSIKSIEMAPK